MPRVISLIRLRMRFIFTELKYASSEVLLLVITVLVVKFISPKLFEVKVALLVVVHATIHVKFLSRFLLSFIELVISPFLLLIP